MTTDPRDPKASPDFRNEPAEATAKAAEAIMILTENWARPKAEAFVDRDGIHFAAMLSAHDEEDVDDGTCANPTQDGGGCGRGRYWSSGEALMLRLTWNLWAGSNDSAVNLARLIDTCGERMLCLALEAIEARNGGQLPVYDRVRSGDRQAAWARPGSTWAPGITNTHAPTPLRRRPL